jgi:cell division protein FtsI/penicillin-binding protein 2
VIWGYSGALRAGALSLFIALTVAGFIRARSTHSTPRAAAAGSSTASPSSPYVPGGELHTQGPAIASGALTRDELASALADPTSFYRFPSRIDVPADGTTTPAVVSYAFDPSLQKEMQKLFTSYTPDYGAFVAIDPATGRVLSMVSYSKGERVHSNLALRATFPSASVFKLVTAAAAIEERNLSPNSLIGYNGRNHTLYKGNILREKYTRWTRFVTLKEAFARSINTVFGKLGAFTVGPAELRDYADRFGFNRKIESDMPIQEGRAPIPDDAWGAAEAASGYTRDNTMSPLQGALIAAAVVNDGQMMEPYLVESARAPDGSLLYLAEPRLSRTAVDARTAAEIRSLGRETVTQGTSRRSFRGFFRGPLAALDVGGKTGSLSGNDPKGKYDWFVGWARSGTRKIAVGVLTIHEKLWRVKSSYLARRAFEQYFKHPAITQVAMIGSPGR